MNKSLFTILKNEQLVPEIYRMVLSGDTSAITAPGQFVNIALDGFYLRRPISVCDWKEGELTILYKVVGQGTQFMSHLSAGSKLDLLTGLGNGYKLERSGTNPLLIGGGVGIPPLYGLAKHLIAKGSKPSVILGFNQKSEAFYIEEFQKLGLEVTVTTVDGSLGIRGYVTDGIKGETPTHLYTCGPEGMLHAVYDSTSCDGEFSFEERMGCGFGACMGCSCETIYGYKRICKEGPVLERGEILW